MREIHTVFDYVDWRGDLSFAQDPFNEVDSVILSMVCFLDFSDIVPAPHESGSISLRDAMAHMPREFEGERRLGAILPDDILYMSHLAAESERYGAAELFAFENIIDEEKEMQFCACTYDLHNGSRCIPSIFGHSRRSLYTLYRACPSSTPLSAFFSHRLPEIFYSLTERCRII